MSYTCLWQAALPRKRSTSWHAPMAPPVAAWLAVGAPSPARCGTDGPAPRARRALPSHARAARRRAGAPGDGGAAGELYRVPAHAAWFRYNAVNPIERSELPDFFSGKHAARNPAVRARVPAPPPPPARPTKRRRRGWHPLRPCGAAPGGNTCGHLGCLPLSCMEPLSAHSQRQCTARTPHTGLHHPGAHVAFVTTH